MAPMNSPPPRLTQVREAFRRFDRRRVAALVAEEIREGPPSGIHWGNVEAVANQVGEIEYALEAARRFSLTEPRSLERALHYCSMLAVRGRLVRATPERVVIETGGVGYDVHVSLVTFSELDRAGVGAEVAIHVHTHVREDQLALYGSPDERQLKLFESLLGVTGIGPKVALSILGTMPPDALENAIATGNVDLLTRAPGIGRKTATRLVLELKGKLDIVTSAGIMATPSAASEVVEALTGLGYSPAEIQAALSHVPRDEQLTTEEMVLFAIQRLGR